MRVTGQDSLCPSNMPPCRSRANRWGGVADLRPWSSIDGSGDAIGIIEENKPVVLALAQALIDHPERTLSSKEIDGVIAKTLEREARAAEQARRAAWQRTVENAASFTSSDS
jgi:hypothetical protein